MKVYGLFFGGSSYACPTASDPSHAEEFTSVEAARRVLRQRIMRQDPRFPCVDATAEIHLFSVPPSTLRDPYPWKLVRYAENGKVIVEDC